MCLLYRNKYFHSKLLKFENSFYTILYIMSYRWQFAISPWWCKRQRRGSHGGGPNNMSSQEIFGYCPPTWQQWWNMQIIYTLILQISTQFLNYVCFLKNSLLFNCSVYHCCLFVCLFTFIWPHYSTADINHTWKILLTRGRSLFYVHHKFLLH